MRVPLFLQSAVNSLYKNKQAIAEKRQALIDCLKTMPVLLLKGIYLANFYICQSILTCNITGVDPHK